MKEFVSQVSYLRSIKDEDVRVAVFTYRNTDILKIQQWEGWIKNVNLSTAAEIIYTFFNSPNTVDKKELEVKIGEQKIYITKSTENTADSYLSQMASMLKF